MGSSSDPLLEAVLVSPQLQSFDLLASLLEPHLTEDRAEPGLLFVIESNYPKNERLAQTPGRELLVVSEDVSLFRLLLLLLWLLAVASVVVSKTNSFVVYKKVLYALLISYYNHK